MTICALQQSKPSVTRSFFGLLGLSSPNLGGVDWPRRGDAQRNEPR